MAVPVNPVDVDAVNVKDYDEFENHWTVYKKSRKKLVLHYH